MKKVRGLDLRADVIFSVERGHSDGRFGIKDGRSVSQSSINVSLLRDKKDTLSETLRWCFVFF